MKKSLLAEVRSHTVDDRKYKLVETRDGWDLRQQYRKSKSLKHTKVNRPQVKRGLTACLFLPAALGIVLLFVGFCSGVVSWSVNFFVTLPLFWYCYMTAHDAIHRATHKNLVVNNMIGWFASGLFLLPFSLLRKAHLSHHCTADGNGDIERFAYQPGWRLPFGVLFGNLFFYSYFGNCNGKDKRSAVFFVLLIVTLFLCFPKQICLGWFLPMQFVFAWGMFTNIYLPHGPYSHWVEKHFPFVTGFHEEHHAVPSYPWHQLCEPEIRDVCQQARERRNAHRGKLKAGRN